MRYEHPGQQAAWVSHEAIYTWIYALPTGELSRLGILLRTGRTQRRPRGRRSGPGARTVGMTSIDARPVEVADRAVPGHWEGDLVIGKAGKTAMAAHAAFSLTTEVTVYFAHPHAPWERATNENTDGPLREYFPKGTEITDDRTYLDRVAAELNNWRF